MRARVAVDCQRRRCRCLSRPAPLVNRFIFLGSAFCFLLSFESTIVFHLVASKTPVEWSEPLMDVGQGKEGKVSLATDEPCSIIIISKYEGE